jgi:hypothetical protein
LEVWSNFTKLQWGSIWSDGMKNIYNNRMGEKEGSVEGRKEGRYKGG